MNTPPDVQPWPLILDGKVNFPSSETLRRVNGRTEERTDLDPDKVPTLLQAVRVASGLS